MGTEIKANLPKGSFLCVFIMHIVRAFIAVKVIMRTHIKGDGIPEETVFLILSCFGDVLPSVNFGTISFIHHQSSAVIVKLFGIV